MTTTTGNTYSFLQFIDGKEKRIFPLYFLEGEDKFLVWEAVRYLISKILPPGLIEFNYSKLRGDKTLKATDIYSICMEFPINASKRVVYLEDISKVTAEERDRLAIYIEEGFKGTILIISSFSSPLQKAKSGKKLESVIKSKAAYVQCQMTEKEIEEWIISSMKHLGYEMRQDAAHFLRKRLGSDIWLIDLELKKLRAFCGNKKIVSRQDIEAISTYTPQAQMYQLTEHIIKGDSHNALKTFHELISQSDPSIGTLNYINRFFLGILEVQKAFREIGSMRDVARALKKPEYVIRKNLEVASKIKEHHLHKLTELLLMADLGMKRGKEKRLIFETLIIHLCTLFKRRES